MMYDICMTIDKWLDRHTNDMMYDICMAIDIWLDGHTNDMMDMYDNRQMVRWTYKRHDGYV